MHEVARFYCIQLHRHSEAVAYLYQRGIRSPEVIEHMRIGYAPGGQHAAQCLSRSLRERGIPTRLVSLPEGHDPNSFFVGGGKAHEFQRLLEEACL